MEEQIIVKVRRGLSGTNAVEVTEGTVVIFSCQHVDHAVLPGVIRIVVEHWCKRTDPEDVDHAER